ncbi:hypothetical protein GCM10009092_37470 [Bowmanella denitrificans]|uniref:Heparinase II/III-like protein n=2 Tax=Bowmanella denitrificans TaxID=366582 RepID=A0ABN0XPM5_9ALTE
MPLHNAALKHFNEALAAMEMTEGWPNGFSYWINNRALIFFMAAAAYINGTDAPRKSEVLALLERIGLWQIYMTRPDHRIAAIGDEGPRTDLKDESSKVIDLLAKLTKNMVFVDYSKYLRNLHGAQSYYRGHRWLFPLVYDASLYESSETPSDLSFLNGVLPHTEVFGRGYYNQVVMRSGWSADSLFLQIRGGGLFSHHQHYDAGHFTLFNRNPVALDGAVYTNNYYKDSRLNYSIRSVAKNTILLPLAGETVRPNRFFTENVNLGGQNILFPTGSAIRSVSHWHNLSEKKPALLGAKLKRMRAQDSHFSVAEFDLAQSYNRPDMRKVVVLTRMAILLPTEKVVVIHDQASGLLEGIVPKFILHTSAKPLLSEPKVLSGNQQHGISTFVHGATIEFDNQKWKLRHLTSEFISGTVFSGQHYRYSVANYVSPDNLRFDNQSDGAQIKSWFDNPSYRLEMNIKFDQAGQFNHMVMFDLRDGNEEFEQYNTSDGQKLVNLKNHVLIFSGKRDVVQLPAAYQGKSILVVADEEVDAITVNIEDKKKNFPLINGIGYFQLPIEQD